MAVSTDSTAAVPTGVLDTPTPGPSKVSAFTPNLDLDIIDIRSAAVEFNLKEDIHAHFKPKDGPRKMPTLLLYNERGLQLFEKVIAVEHGSTTSFLSLTARQITYLEEYYLTNDEIKVLKDSAASVAERIPEGAMVIELGSG